jgi:hypothetical protein
LTDERDLTLARAIAIEIIRALDDDVHRGAVFPNFADARTTKAQRHRRAATPFAMADGGGRANGRVGAFARARNRRRARFEVRARLEYSDYCDSCRVGGCADLSASNASDVRMMRGDEKERVD